MSVKPVSPEETKQLLEAGYIYVDVRTEPEFELGHVPGALNVPLMHQGASGMVANPEFLSVMQSAFGKHEKLVVGCRSGARSKRATGMLLEAGFTELADQTSGFEGARDAFGRAIPGWRQSGLEIESGKPAGQAYSDVKNRKPA